MNLEELDDQVPFQKVSRFDPDFKLLSRDDLDEWTGQVHVAPGYDATQHQAFLNLIESLSRLVQKRAHLHQAGINYQGIAALAKSLDEVQLDLYFATETYFQGLYSSISQLANVVHRFKRTFGDIAYSSNEKFLRSLGEKYPEIQLNLGTLEIGRQHRTFLDHPASSQVSAWFTTNTEDARHMTVQHVGSQGESGSIPKMAYRGANPHGGDWVKDTPNHLEIDMALKLVVAFVVDRITLEPQPSGESPATARPR